MECLDEGLIQAYIDGEVAPNEVKEINSHLEKCPVCAKNVKLQKKISSDVLGAMNLLTNDDFELPVPNPAPNNVRSTYTFRKVFYIVSAASILFFVLVFFGKKEQNVEMPPNLLYELDWELDANKPITDQDFTISVWQIDGNISESLEQ